MIIGVDARVLVHQPTGVARYLRGLLGAYPPLRGENERLRLYVDRPPTERLPGPADAWEQIAWRPPGGDPAWRQLRLAAHVRRHPPEVLFCPFYSIPLAARCPSVVTIHDVSFLAHPEWFRWRSRLAFSLVGPSARRASKVLTVSRFSATEIVERLGVPAARIEIIPPGIDEQWGRPIREGEWDGLFRWLEHTGAYLLHLGAVHERRNPFLLLESFARVCPDHEDLALVIAGPTMQPSPDLDAAIDELGLSGRVRRRQWVPEPLLRPLIAGARALAYLSSYEGFGLPALEAMSVGTPVIALRCASLPEVLGDAAVWVENPTLDEVSAAFRELLDSDAAVETLRQRGLERAAQFRWERAARATFEVLREVAGR
ncbi:MAG: glycosyltransferase family 4 protein [Acidobacteriota bacterium]|nr:MAG: glycosyltransferase family 4 protein [Acidobacteriota bacterium]